jgi:hypothetical protein
MDEGERNPATDSAASSGRAAIEAAFASMPGVDFGDDTVPAAPRPAESPASDEKPASASTTTVAASDASPKPEENARPVDGQPASPVAVATLEAPKHWPADRRASFQTLPDDAKRIILERNKEANVAVTKSQQEAAQFRRTTEAIGSLFSDDHRRQMQSAGLDEVGAIQYLVQQHDALNRDPVGFLKAVIAQTGVKPEQLFGAQAPAQVPGAQPQPEAAAEWRDPDVIALEQKLAKIEEIENRRQQEAQQRERSDAQRFQSWFNDQCVAFETAMDDEGNPKYAHLPAVMNDVVRLVSSDPAAKALLRSNPQQALEQAYNQAVYLNPDIRQSIIDADFERRLSERDSANSVKKVQAAVTRKGGPGANGVANARKNMSITESVDAAWKSVLGQ